MIIETISKFCPFVNAQAIAYVRRIVEGGDWDVTMRDGHTLHFTPAEMAPILLVLQAAGKCTRRQAETCGEED